MFDMGMYVKEYIRRVPMILIAVAAVLVSSLLCYGLFHEKLNKVSGQLYSYDSADYSIIYILNYGEAFSNECLFPDTDIQFYRDADRSQRLTVSSVMREEGVLYDLKYLDSLSELNPGEVCISRNVAEKYRIGIGETLFAEYSYSPIPVPVTVTAIIQTEFDYAHPATDNDIGVVFLGYNKDYVVSTNSKYILFSEKTKADELAAYPQIINEVINKSTSKGVVYSQGLAALIIGALLSVASVIVSQMVFFSKSKVLLYRCYLKGMKRLLLPVVPLFERLVFCLLPCVIAQFLVTSTLPDSAITKIYRMIPTTICGLFCIIMFVVDLFTLRRKGR